MIVFNVAVVGCWVAHGNRYQGSGGGGSYSGLFKGEYPLEPWFSICKICIVPALTLHKERKEKFLIWGAVIALRDHFVNFDEKTEAKVG